MTKPDLESFYSSRKASFSKQASEVSRKINLISHGRLALAIVFILLVYFTFSNSDIAYGLPVVLIAFIALVRIHGKLFAEKTHLENLTKVNSHELQALQGDISCFDRGSQFIDPHHPYAYDLDLFGDGSLFQFINRSNTLSGKNKFAQRLLHPLSTTRDIMANQQAVQELATRPDFLQHFQSAGMEIDEQPGDQQQLFAWLKQPSFVFGKFFYRIILLIAPVITIAAITSAFFVEELKVIAILSVAFQWLFLSFHLKRIHIFHDYISRKKIILQKYAHLLHLLQGNDFSSDLMKDLAGKAHRADQKVSSLASLVSALDARLNSMTMLVMNSLLLYDLQCVYRLEKWKEENAPQLPVWLDTVSQMEVVVNFGTLYFNHRHFVFPAIQKELYVAGKAISHPLIPEHESVSNDFLLGKEQSVLIITGANMAGKSTFLRTVGVNLILALNGAPVSAKEFQCPVINLRTGMRTADSLKDHQSYFYAELDRLKGIMEELRSEKPLLILLDEILKGTNSTDKQAGSMALIKQLLPHPCLAVIATHDLALGELEKEHPHLIKNFCFEANIENDQLSFDYKLKPGLAQKMNATFLMKKMGIIPV